MRREYSPGSTPRIAPRLRESGEWRSQPNLITEWLAGTDAQTICAEFRREADWESRRDLHRIVGSVLRAYRELHERGILHGDVHPRNVLIDGRQSARIVYFGHAELLEEGQSSAAPRAGVSFFFDPEFAEEARKEGRASVPNASQRTVFGRSSHLFVADGYVLDLDFVLEKDAMLRQIAEYPIVPFAGRAHCALAGRRTAPREGAEQVAGRLFPGIADGVFACVGGGRDFTAAGR